MSYLYLFIIHNISSFNQIEIKLKENKLLLLLLLLLLLNMQKKNLFLLERYHVLICHEE